MIRKTLSHTQRATYSVLVQVASEPVPRPAGTGFFVRADGLFATAAHVLESSASIHLSKESDRGADPSMPITEVCFNDAATDFALLRARPDPKRQAEFGDIACLQPSERVLDEGEPVYAFGYPLCEPGPPLTLTPEQLREILGDGPMALLPRLNPGQTLSLMNHRLSPRTTSAIVASNVEYHDTFAMPENKLTQHLYILDKALNYGNSGGPIIATESGRVHAFCTRFQPVTVPQNDPRGPVVIPSLYGVVTRLSHPVIRKALESWGVTFDST
jgi:serine protease Do